MQVVTMLKFLALMRRFSQLHGGHSLLKCTRVRGLHHPYYTLCRWWQSVNGDGVEHTRDGIFYVSGYKIDLGFGGIRHVCLGAGVHVTRGVAHVGGGAILIFSFAKLGVVARTSHMNISQTYLEPCNNGLPRTCCRQSPPPSRNLEMVTLMG